MRQWDIAQAYRHLQNGGSILPVVTQSGGLCEKFGFDEDPVIEIQRGRKSSAKRFEPENDVGEDFLMCDPS